MFRKEDYVVYGDLGVCQVQDIVERKFDGLGKDRLYYVLAPGYQDGVQYVPEDNPRFFLRAVISAASSGASAMMGEAPAASRRLAQSLTVT